MKIIRLKQNPSIYCGNAYLVLGTWNKISDVNALIDTGTDGYIINEIDNTNTGVGKSPIDKIFLTHNHFDHSGGVLKIKEKYNAKVYASISGLGVDFLLKEGEEILLGDEYFEVIFTPGHSSDSVCFYCKKEKILFSGDTVLRVNMQDGSYTEDYINTIEKLAKLRINTVYPGHGEALVENPEKIIHNTLKIITKKTTII
ncbi:MAG TPA: MBL fold metallo-hydrolase [Melioribacteraceae bacterium]|nr:MBL fold metallo-hydrolase [Melioribacteraceae bacterium]